MGTQLLYWEVMARWSSGMEMIMLNKDLAHPKVIFSLHELYFEYSVLVQTETACNKDKDNEEKDSDQYLVR